MALFFSLQNFVALLVLVLIFLCLLPLARPFTVIMSDSSGLVDGPQSGYSINKNGIRTDPHEQEAVYDIMRATGNNWATDIPDVCRSRWHGIECMPDKDNIYHIVSLSFGALSDDTAFPPCDPTRSYISPSITKLPHLRTLLFYRCLSYIPQPIPAFLGKLGSTLQTLVLRENGHVGPLPSELGNLTHLRVLDLHKNNLNGSIPVSLGQVTGLRSLDLSGNKLTGSIPSLNFSVLNILDLNQNLLTGSIPPSLGTCHSLIKIDFSRNRLNGPIPDSISGLTNLMLLDLSYNRLSGPLPSPLRSLTSLQALNLKGNSMGSNPIPSHCFEGLKGLMILILSNMNLHGPIPESLGRLTNLRVLYLDNNYLNGSIPSNFQDLKNLSELRLNDNRLTGRVPLGRDMVWRMRSKLRLYNNSGLCYNANSGFEEDLDSWSHPGIGSCDMPKPEPARTVRHLSTSGSGPRTFNVSSDAVFKFSVFVRLLQLTSFVLCTLTLM